ncbi:Fc.00g008650.m01.CDS01 [Cosmosporella sp. VM-42]
MSIRRLPEDVVDKIKSSVVITSLNGVACGLLTNSLDSGATKVHISVDYIRGNCTVEDNGSGILPDEFKDGGGLGKLHHTSRFPPMSNTHGKHGDFLASLATLSLLSITSRHQSHFSHNSISIHHSQVLSRHYPSRPEQRLVNFDYGTRVTVRDLFGSLPVRVKQRATMAERSIGDKEWTKLIRDVVALLLAWPTGTAVTLRDSVTQRELNFRPPQKTDAVSRTSRLLAQVSPADAGGADSWIPISASCGSVKVKGCIYANPVATRRSQFISLGIQPVTNEYGTDILYEEINRIFSHSSFGITENEECQARDSPKLDGFSGKGLRSRKGIERWPMFYLKITVSNGADTTNVNEKLDSRGKDLTAILDLLKAVCYSFLKKHHFSPQKIRMSTDESVFSTTTTLGRRKGKGQTTSSGSSRSGSITRSPGVDSLLSRSNSPFDGWDRVKVGRAAPFCASAKSEFVQPKEPEAARTVPLVGQRGKLLRKPFDEPSPEPEETLETAPDPSTATIISATGFPPFKRPLDESETAAKKRRRLDVEGKPQPSEWLQKVQKSWTNPVFEAAEPSVPQIYDDSAPPPRNHGHVSNCCGGQHGGISSAFASMSLNGRVSKKALAHATVISQVDRKFILVKLPLENVNSEDSCTGKGSTLIMLDQHAVDERCRLEDLMAGYFANDATSGGLNAIVESLKRPLVFDVLTKESDLLEQYHDHFAAWGVLYQPKSQKGKVVVTDLPPSILERCCREPRLLIEMLRREIWRIVDEGRPTRKGSSNAESDKPWITNFHGCPQGILEMLYSRSCRSLYSSNPSQPVTDLYF